MEDQQDVGSYGLSVSLESSRRRCIKNGAQTPKSLKHL